MARLPPLSGLTFADSKFNMPALMFADKLDDEDHA